jgi:hypothetical protein
VKFGDQSVEVPTRYTERFAMDLSEMADYWNQPKFRESLLIVHQSHF